MRQYRQAQTNFAGCAGMSGVGTMRVEALLVSSYDPLCRANRRRINGSALAWWREQTKSFAMPNSYHCGGVS